jgi:hypothetical protein
MRKKPLFFPHLQIALQLLAFASVIGLVRTSFGQQPNAEAINATAFSGYLRYASQALKVGTAITAFIGILKAITEWSASGRKNRALEKATRLAAFVDAVTKMARTCGESGANSKLLENAQREFVQVSSRCHRAKSAPSKIRQAFLIYLPPRLIAYIPHFLFLTLCALAVSAAIGISGDILDKSADVGDLMVVLIIGVPGLLHAAMGCTGVEERSRNRIITSTPISWVAVVPGQQFLGSIR